jgi:hypothetical protein
MWAFISHTGRSWLTSCNELQIWKYLKECSHYLIRCQSAICVERFLKIMKTTVTVGVLVQSVTIRPHISLAFFITEEAKLQNCWQSPERVGLLSSYGALSHIMISIRKSIQVTVSLDVSFHLFPFLSLFLIFLLLLVTLLRLHLG